MTRVKCCYLDDGTDAGSVIYHAGCSGVGRCHPLEHRLELGVAAESTAAPVSRNDRQRALVLVRGGPFQYLCFYLNVSLVRRKEKEHRCTRRVPNWFRVSLYAQAAYTQFDFSLFKEGNGLRTRRQSIPNAVNTDNQIWQLQIQQFVSVLLQTSPPPPMSTPTDKRTIDSS